MSALLLAVALLLSACGGGEDETAASGEGKSFAVGYAGTPGIGDLGTFLAWEEMRTRGWDIEIVVLSDADVAIQALDRGDVDVATNLTVEPAMRAIQSGIALRIFTGYVGNEWVVAGKKEIETPEDLEGKVYPVHGEGGGTDIFMGALADKYGYPHERIVIPNSSARREALTQGRIDAAPLDMADGVFIEEEHGDDFHIITFFGDEFDIANSGTVGTEQFIEDNPEAVQAIATTLLATYRKMQEDPDWAAEQSLRFFGALYEDNVELLKETVRTYIDRQLWPPEDTGLSREAAAETIEFNARYGELDATPADIDQFYDFTFIENAKEELGQFNE